MTYLPRRGWGRGKLHRSLDSTDPIVRTEAMRLLGSSGKVDPERIYPLLSDSDSKVRLAACILLGTTALPAAVPYLVKTLARDTNPQVCRYAAWAINQIPEEPRLEQLASLFIQTNVKQDKRIAAIGLRQSRYIPVVDELARTFATGEHHTWRDVNKSTIEDLSILGYYVVEPLISYLQSNDTRMQVNTALALGRIGDGRAAPTLAKTLRNVEQQVRPSISIALVELKEDAVEPVVELLDDKNKEVRLTAAQVLGNIGEPAVSSLLETLRRRDPNNMEEVIYALGLTRNPETFYPLLKTYEMSDDDRIKAWSVIALILSCAHNYKQVEEKKDLVRALDIIKESLSPHSLLGPDTMFELGRAYLYINRFSDEVSNVFHENLETALACFSISLADEYRSNASLYYTFIDAYLRALRASSVDVIEFQEASVRRELETSDYPLDDPIFTSSIRALLSLFRELKDMKGLPVMQHYDAYTTALSIAEDNISGTRPISSVASNVIHTQKSQTEDRITYIMQDLINDLMVRMENDLEAASLLQDISLEILKTETGVSNDLSRAQQSCKELVGRLPVSQKKKDDLTLKSLEINKVGIPQVRVVLAEIAHVLPKKMKRRTKIAIIVSIIAIAAITAFAALEYLGIINLVQWL